MTSELYQMNVDQCVPFVLQLHYFIQGLERCRLNSIQ